MHSYEISFIPPLTHSAYLPSPISHLPSHVSPHHPTDGKLTETEPILVIKKPSSNPLNPNQIVCYGVIHFADRDDAEAARNATNGEQLEPAGFFRLLRTSVIFPSDPYYRSDPPLRSITSSHNP